MNIPTSWKQVPIKHFGLLVHIASQTGMDELDQRMSCLAVLTDSTKEQVEALPFDDLRQALKDISFIYSFEPKPRLVPYIDIGQYRFHLVQEVPNIDGGTYLSVRKWTEDEESFRSNLHNIIAALTTKVTRKKFIGRVEVEMDFARKAQLAYEAPVSDAYDYSLFFSIYYLELNKNMASLSLKLGMALAKRGARAMKRELRRERRRRALRSIGLSTIYWTGLVKETERSGTSTQA